MTSSHAVLVGDPGCELAMISSMAVPFHTATLKPRSRASFRLAIGGRETITVSVEVRLACGGRGRGETFSMLY